MKIRVLHCIETIASGGVEQTILTLIKGLNKERFSHRIICTWAGGPVAEALKNEGVEIFQVGSFKHPFEFSKYKFVLSQISEYKPYILHGAVFEGMCMAAVGSFFGRTPVTILEETSDPQNRSRLANLLLRFLSKQADVVQAISVNVGNYLKVNAGIKAEKIRVITNGIQFPIANNYSEILSLRDHYSIKEDYFVVGFVGRLHDDHKRVSDLIKAISLIDHEKIKLLIVGDGNDKEHLIKIVNNLKLKKKVLFVGFQANTQVYFNLMNVLVVPSSREGFGLVAVEGMIQKLPVIGTKVGGLQDIIKDGETGFLVPPFSPESIAGKIQLLIDQPDLRKTMGEKGKRRAIENFTAERYCREVENLYHDLLKKKSVVL